MSTATILDRFFDPVTEAFTPELAQKIINLCPDPEWEAYVSILRCKANEGILTPEEKIEYQDFVEALDLISNFQAKSHRFLASHQIF